MAAAGSVDPASANQDHGGQTIPPWTPAECAFFGLTLALGIGWSAVVALISPGWSLDDELSHYLRSRSVWAHPPLLFDAWTRIGRNLFHLLPATIDLDAARLWTLAFAGVAVLVTTDLARRLGVRRAWLIPLLLCFQPWFVELSWGVLTQTPFLLAWVLGTWALVTRRLVLSGLCFGVLPLIRHEGLALTALWGAAVVGERILRARGGATRPRGAHTPLLLALFAAATPLLAYNLGALFVLGELPSRIFAVAKPTDLYGSGPLWHFAEISWKPAGLFTLTLAAIGLLPVLRRWRVTWVLASYPAYFALHSVIFWQGLFASGGYHHFLMPMAPALAIVAAFGADRLLDARGRAARVAAAILLAGTFVQGIWLWHLQQNNDWRFTLHRDPITAALDEAVAWQKRERPAAPAVKCQHIYVHWREDWVETPARRALFVAPPAGLPPAGIFVWDAKYADVTGAPLEAIAAHPDFAERARFGDGSVRVFEKLR